MPTAERRVACVGRIRTTPYGDDGTVIRATRVTEVGEDSGRPVTVTILRSKGPGTDNRWSQPAFDLGDSGGFFATPDELIRHAHLTTPEKFETKLSDDQMLQAMIEHDARAGLPGFRPVIPGVTDE